MRAALVVVVRLAPLNLLFFLLVTAAAALQRERLDGRPEHRCRDECRSAAWRCCAGRPPCGKMLLLQTFSSAAAIARCLRSISKGPAVAAAALADKSAEIS